MQFVQQGYDVPQIYMKQEKPEEVRILPSEEVTALKEQDWADMTCTDVGVSVGTAEVDDGQ